MLKAIIKQPYKLIRPSLQVMRQTFDFGHYPRVQAKVRDPEAEIYYCPEKDVVGFRLGAYCFEVTRAEVAGQVYVNFWRYVFGLDRRIMAGRKRQEDPQLFFHNFLRAISRGTPFAEFLATRTNRDGMVLFEDHGQIFACPTAVNRNGLIRNRLVYLAPERVFDDLVSYIFPARGGADFELDFDPLMKRFFMLGAGQRKYPFILKPVDNSLAGSLPGHEFHFPGAQRVPGECIRVTMADGEIQGFSSYRCGSSVDNLTFKPSPRQEPGRKITIIGQQARGRLAPTGVVLEVKILEDKSGQRYFYFGNHYPVRLTSGVRERYGLETGDTLMVESQNGWICSLTTEEKKGSVRIPFLLNWQWDKKAQKFVLVYSTRSGMRDDYVGGARLIEQNETCQVTKGSYGLAAGSKYAPPLISGLPWQIEPLPLSTLAVDVKQVLFFTDNPRLSRLEWQVVNTIMMLRTGKLDNFSAKPAEAATLAEQAAEIGAKAQADLFELKGLEAAYELYCRAFCCDPQNEDYLPAALALKRLSLERQLQLQRRRHHLEVLLSKTEILKDRDKAAAFLLEMADGQGHNRTTLAYFFEVLAGLAEGHYCSDGRLYREALLALPQVIAETQAYKRLGGAMRLLLHDPELSHIPRYVFSHPPEGEEGKFNKRRESLGVLHDDTPFDWARQRKTLIVGKPPEDKLDQLMPTINQLVAAMHQLVAAPQARNRIASAKKMLEQARGLQATLGSFRRNDCDLAEARRQGVRLSLVAFKLKKIANGQACVPVAVRRPIKLEEERPPFPLRRGPELLFDEDTSEESPGGDDDIVEPLSRIKLD